MLGVENIQDPPGSYSRLVSRLRGDPIHYDLSPWQSALDQINALDENMRSLPDSALQALVRQLKEKRLKEKSADALLIEAFALVRESSHRILGMRHFDEQILTGIVLHQGLIAEMPTGEGKTLAATLPAFLNALDGKGLHILTFNDYLARRDARWMGPIYEFLGLTVSTIQSSMTTLERQQAYRADITYLTAKEAGFDYLRDGLAYDPDEKRHRALSFAIVDEADSILIDEARIPLVIAGGTSDPKSDLGPITALVQSMVPGRDYKTDGEKRNVFLSEVGLLRAEAALKCDDLFASHNADILTLINQALHARALLHRDIDYIVRNDSIELVDEMTGRVARDRQWPDGLHAALEAKEGLRQKGEGEILGSVSIKDYFALYPRLCGMTASARPAEYEFWESYNLKVVTIPSHKKSVRKDQPDQIFAHKDEKFAAIAKEVISANQKRRPVLVGTATVAESEALAQRVRSAGVECSVLNARTDDLEAAIIAEAGAPGAVTISTNMAGRGVDIRLGGSDEGHRPEVLKAGGLFVIGSNRHESRRVDNQLRGRSARQGEPGSTLFFISLDDELITRYGIHKSYADQENPERDSLFNNPQLRDRIAWAQRVIEGQNLSIRHTLNRYTSIVEKQRQIIRNIREQALRGEGLFCHEDCPEHWLALEKELGTKRLQEIERQLTLIHIDRVWAEHLKVIADLREGIPMMGLGHSDPYSAFLREANAAYEHMMSQLDEKISQSFQSLKVIDGDINLAAQGIRGPSSTWTYLIDDDPFKNALGLNVGGNLGLSIGAAFYWPLYMAAAIYQRWFKKE